MDEKNERSVWGMLLDVCKDHQAQYFYMAPKFPQNLPFNRQVTFIVIWRALSITPTGHAPHL